MTLIELTVVVAILAMLMTLAVPAVSQVIAQARTDSSKATIAQLTAGALEFGEEVTWLPWSQHDDYLNWTGSQLLRLQLTGYGPDNNDDGIPGEGDNPELNTLYDDDGAPGFGFRRYCRGKVFGPYQGTDDNDFVFQKAGMEERSVFVDAFANEIFYYRAEPDGTYVDGHNPGAEYHDETAFRVDTYAEGPDERKLRGDFLIFSAGADGRLESFVSGDDTPSDDITNFLPEN